MQRPAADWNIAARGQPAQGQADRGQPDGQPELSGSAGADAFAGKAGQWETPAVERRRSRRPIRRSGSRLVPVLMLLAAYGFAWWAFVATRGDGAALPAGYEYMLLLTGVPFVLAAHAFAVVRWNQLRKLDELQGTVRDVSTDVALSVWEIFFCWLGISASLMFLYHAAPVAELKDWYPRFFLVLVVFFGATYQKSLVFAFALLPFVVTLTGLSLWVYGVRDPWALGGDLDTAVGASLLVADLAVLWWAVKLTARHGGFRVCEFQMPLGAGYSGGYLAGVVRTRQKSVPQAGFQLHLSCLQQYKQGDKNGKRQGQVLWHAQKTVRGDLPGARHTDTSLPVTFAIPDGAPPTSIADEDNRVTWTLRATAALPETDFSCLFEVPVRRSADAQMLQPPIHLVHAQGAQLPNVAPVSRQNAHGGTVFSFRTAWNRATELATVAYFLFWFQLVWLATSHRIGWETWGIFGVGLWFLGWAMRPWITSTTVTVTPSEGTIKVINRRLLMKTNKVVLIDDLRDVVVKPSSLRTGLMEALDFYHLELQQANGKAVVAGRHLRDPWQAKVIAQTMKEFIAGAVR